MKKEKPARPCANCGAELIGKFCHECGEKKVSKKEFAAAGIIKDAFEKFTHFDSRLLRSLWLLMSRPGFLTVEFLNGRRKPYAKPFSLFFIINVLYFITIGINNFRTYETPLQVQRINPYSPIVADMLEHRLAGASEVEKKAFEAQFDRQNHLIAKSMLILIVPMIACALWLLYLKKPIYLGEHFLTAIHFQALLLVQNMLLGIVFGSSFTVLLFGYPPGWQLMTEFLEPLLWIGGLAFFTLKTVYRENHTRTALKAAALALLWMPMLIIYRFLVFLVTFYSI